MPDMHPVIPYTTHGGVPQGLLRDLSMLDSQSSITRRTRLGERKQDVDNISFFKVKMTDGRDRIKEKDNNVKKKYNPHYNEFQSSDHRFILLKACIANSDVRQTLVQSIMKISTNKR